MLPAKESANQPTFRWSSLIGLLIIAVAGVVAGAPPLTITDAGYYLMIVDDAGLPSLVEVESIIDLRTGEGPESPDPPPPGIAADTAKWAKAVDDPSGAQKLAMVFETVRDAVADDLVSSLTLYGVIKESSDFAVDDNWGAFRRTLSDHLTARAQEGALNTKTQLVNELESIRYGLAWSAYGSPKVPTEENAAIVAKVIEIIEGADNE